MSMFTHARTSLLTTTAAVVATAALATSVAPATAAHTTRPASDSNLTGTVSHPNTLTPEVRALMKGTGPAAEAAALAAYWTPARMKSAAPWRPQKIPGSAARVQTTAAEGPMRVVDGTAPTKAPGIGGVLQWLPTGYPPSFSTARTVGKVFFDRVIGSTVNSYVCSATIVKTAGLGAVWSSGDCVYDYANGVSGPRVWSSNFTFVPAYNGSAPYGYWFAQSLLTTNAWITGRVLKEDFGATCMQPDASGVQIASALGSQGILFNASPAYTARAFGYPSSVSSGQTLQRANGTTANAGSTLISMNAVGSADGAVGGPWLRNWNPSRGYGRINGHNMVNQTGSPTTMLSPYYGPLGANFYNTVTAQC